jgi:HD superfamily phosphodiesterase
VSSTAADSIAGVVIPDTELVREITAFIRDAEDDLLFDHSRRVFLFGVLQGRRRGLQPDLELLYAGAMFHDIGLTETYRTSMLRFEVDGANAARDFLLAHGVGEANARKGLAEHRVAHHTQRARIPQSGNRFGHRRCGDRRAGYPP